MSKAINLKTPGYPSFFSILIVFSNVKNPKILGFLFSMKNSLTWEVKCEN